MVEKEFVRVSISDLIPYDNNPRKNDNAVPDVAESIKQCGDLDPIEIDENNVILAGHTRLMALMEQGFTETDVIRYTGLTEEQKKKYRILSNKTGEKALWDFDALAEELSDLDFDGFDFDFDLPETDEMEYYGDERERTYKGVNLKDFDPERSDGFYQMPVIKPTQFVPDKLIGFNYARTAKETDCGIHFFIDDYQFERMWNDPDTNIEYLKRYQCALTPDWSLYMDMPMAMKIWNVYRSRLIGQLMQDAGIEVIPTLSWAQPETYQFCFDGLKPGGVIAVSTVGVMRDEEAKKVWADGMTEALKRLKPSMVLCYGSEPTFFDFGNVKTKMISAREWG